MYNIGFVTTARLNKKNRIHMGRSEEHTSELQSQSNLVCRLLLEKKKENERSLLPLLTGGPAFLHHHASHNGIAQRPSPGCTALSQPNRGGPHRTPCPRTGGLGHTAGRSNGDARVRAGIAREVLG